MPSDNVARWRPIIHEVRDLLGLADDTYPDDVVLALIEVESAGDPEARKFDGSQFFGLLQMGRMAGLDVGLDDRGDDTTDMLADDPRTSIELFMRYQERYSLRHRYQPSRIALLWKAGPGTASRVNELLVDGCSMNDAIDQAADEKGVPNALEYVKRFRAARARWLEWLEGQEAPPEVCGEG